MRGGDGVTKASMMKRLEWSMIQNSNQWFTAKEMMDLLLTHRDADVNKNYQRDNGMRLRTPPRFCHAPPNTVSLAYMITKTKRYEMKYVSKNSRSIRAYRLKVEA